MGNFFLIVEIFWYKSYFFGEMFFLNICFLRVFVMFLFNIINGLEIFRVFGWFRLIFGGIFDEEFENKI